MTGIKIGDRVEVVRCHYDHGNGCIDNGEQGVVDRIGGIAAFHVEFGHGWGCWADQVKPIETP